MFHRCAGLFLAPTGFVTFRTVSEQNLQVLAFSGAWPHKGTHRMRDFVCFPSGAHPEVPRKPWRPRWSAPFLPSTRVLQSPRICIFSEQTRLGFVLTTYSALICPRNWRKCTSTTISKVVVCFVCRVLNSHQFSSNLEPPHRARTSLKEPVVHHSRSAHLL